MRLRNHSSRCPKDDSVSPDLTLMDCISQCERKALLVAIAEDRPQELCALELVWVCFMFCLILCMLACAHMPTVARSGALLLNCEAAFASPSTDSTPRSPAPQPTYRYATCLPCLQRALSLSLLFYCRVSMHVCKVERRCVEPDVGFV